MAIKISLIFEGTQRVCGWSETLYKAGSDLDAAQTAIGVRKPLRLAVSPSSVKIVGWRMNVIGSKKNARTGTYTSGNTGTFNAEDDMTEPWSALLMRRANGNTIRTPWFLHGLPQSQVTGGTFTPTNDYLTALIALINDDQNNWYIYAKDPTDPQATKTTWAIQIGTYRRLTSHQIGRPFGLLVGRRLAST